MGVRVREKVPGSGIWWIFVKHKGRRTSRLVGSQAAAEIAQKQIEARLALGEWLPEEPEPEPKAPTLAAYYKRFKDVYLAVSTRKGTRVTYERSFKHILPVLGDIPLNEITRDRIKDLVALLVQKEYEKRVKVTVYPDGKLRNPVVSWEVTKHPLSKSTIRIMLSELCAVFSHAVEENVITANPAMRLGKFYKQARNSREEIQPLTAAEVTVFLDAVLARSASKEYYPLFLCAIHTGMRAGELMGLQWGDVDFHGKFLLVRRAGHARARGRHQDRQGAAHRYV